jgi:hypothetical protein
LSENYGRNEFIKLGPALEPLHTVRALQYCGVHGNMVHYDPANLSGLGRLGSLTELDLSFNAAVNKDLVEALSATCHKLSRLNLMCCQGKPFIDDVALQRLAALKELTHLNLNYLCEITDDGLMHLSQIRCVHLELFFKMHIMGFTPPFFYRSTPCFFPLGSKFTLSDAKAT